MSNHGGSAQPTGDIDEAVNCCLNSTALRATTLSVAGLVVLLMVVLWIWFLLRSRHSLDLPVTAVDDHQEEQSMHGGLSASAIAGLPVFEYRKNNECTRNGDECSICLSSIQDGDMVRLLIHCKHLFHRECVDLWLKSSVNCPVCRSNAGGDKPGLDEAHSASPMVEV